LVATTGQTGRRTNLTTGYQKSSPHKETKPRNYRKKGGDYGWPNWNKTLAGKIYKTYESAQITSLTVSITVHKHKRSILLYEYKYILQ